MRARAILILATLAMTSLAACDRVEERQERISTLMTAAGKQMKEAFGPGKPDPDHANPIENRALAFPVLSDESRIFQRGKYRLLDNSLIAIERPVLPAPVTGGVEEVTEALTFSDVMSVLNAADFEVMTKALPGGAVRLDLSFSDSAEAKTSFHEHVSTVQSPLPACSGDITPEAIATQQGFERLNCLKVFLEDSGAFEAVSFDSMLQADASQLKPIEQKKASPLSQYQWSYQLEKLEATDSDDLPVISILDTGVIAEPADWNNDIITASVDAISDPDAAGDDGGPDRIANDEGDQCNPDNALQSDSFHGTGMIGLFSGAQPAYGKGLDPMIAGYPIVNVRVAGKCGARLSDIMTGLAWAGGLSAIETGEGEQLWIDEPAEMIFLPYSAYGTCPSALQSILDALNVRGIQTVVSAGNNAENTAGIFPANCRNVIAVAASGPDGKLASYSNYGAEVDLMAPGGDLATDLDENGLPDGIILPGFSTENCKDPLTGAKLESCSSVLAEGSSIAALHTLAALAKLAIERPELSGKDRFETLLSQIETLPPEACSGLCTDTPDGLPIDGAPGLCTRACGAGALSLTSAPTSRLKRE